ncbi:class I lanthipeptide [Sinomicrobium weinanense]|uniref:Class I lanthipeptide n=1 Tax=Sinomicrobium weinanense TaxID=2842200 RepID=A0A926JUW5_9FLAO|nr:class I lanthipeptide [Sinomicrobium weinanense]MBC9797631.1 class I lanthipeptide [Sinomicrobium weinanense]MBU3125251.1 class I lanthipeptide [Sinomicrobium weinanense]
MKKKDLKNLSLNKKIISRLDQETAREILGGETGYSCETCPGPTQSIKQDCITVCNNIS